MAGIIVHANPVQLSHQPERRAGKPDFPNFRTLLDAGVVVRTALLVTGLMLASGCAWAVREQTSATIRDMAEHPFDIAPQPALGSSPPAVPVRTGEDPGTSSRRAGPRAPALEVPTDVATSGVLDAPQGQEQRRNRSSDASLEPASWVQPRLEASGPLDRQQRYQLRIPPRLPGSEAPEIVISKDRAEADRQIQRLYPDLPAPPQEPRVQQGPGGKPYTLADLQRLAAANSPALRQAASDVEAAKGNLIQARTYPNPTIGYLQDSAATNNTGGIQAGFIDQPVITGGKQKLRSASAQADLDNAILALKRARSDLSTSVRNAYFTLLVDVETLYITRALAQFSDEIYRLQSGRLRGTQASPYEPTALRAQTYLNRLAYKQAIASYVYDWKALVATLGLPQLPLSEVTGQVDRFIPFYDYDDVRAYVLKNHTDILTARNGVRKAQYNLKLAQVTPLLPNLDVYAAIEHDYLNPPFGTYQTIAVGLPLAIWDQNKGNIIAAQGALVRASKEVRRVESVLTNNLALAYESYRNNLYAMEYYRRNVLPDLVRYYRGVVDRRQTEPAFALQNFGDLVFAQQNLATNVTAYIGILDSLWSSAVRVADFLQTDNLFQTGEQRQLPAVPDFRQLRLSAVTPGEQAASRSGHERGATAH
jgi:cobalt-zinc-cadmium efflux system outer membrane protein